MENVSCRKFEPNMFNKTKCQNCFRQKEEHSSKALEHLRNARKISKCAYLFVAPETFDFTNALDRTRRWQRRFFILYDDGELTYSVDDNVDTIPQGVIDMTTCTEVSNAEDVTGHQFSISVVAPNTLLYVKGGSREEISRWQDILSIFIGGVKVKIKKTFEKSISQPVGISDRNTNGVHPQPHSSIVKTTPALAHGADSSCSLSTSVPMSTGSTSSASMPPSERPAGRPSSTGGMSGASSDRSLQSAGRGLRSGSKPKLDRTKLDLSLHKTGSLQDVTVNRKVSSGASQSVSLGSPLEEISDHSVVHSTLHASALSFDACLVDLPPMVGAAHRDEVDGHVGSSTSAGPLGSVEVRGRRRTRDRRRAATALELDQFGPEGIVSSASKFWEELLNLKAGSYCRSHSTAAIREEGEEEGEGRRVGVESGKGSRRRDSSSPRYSTIGAPCDAHVSLSRVISVQETELRRQNAKVAPIERAGSVNSMISSAPPLGFTGNDTTYVKKGWLLQRSSDKDWVRRWCVLNAKNLSVYQDTGDELLSNAASTLPMTSSTTVSDGDVGHHFAFDVTTGASVLVLSAASHGIRQLWKDAVTGCVMRLSCEDETNSSSETPSAAAPAVEAEAVKRISVERESRPVSVKSDETESASVKPPSVNVKQEVGGEKAGLKSHKALSATTSVDAGIEVSRHVVSAGSEDTSGCTEGDDLSDDSCSAATDMTSDNTLVELLETEVASLKRQLEFSQSQLVEFQKVNTTLRRQIQASGVDRRSESSEELVLDKIRYQLEDIENDSAYVQGKCGRQESDKLLLQIKNLKRKLHQALKTMKSQKKEIESLQNQLSLAAKSRATLEGLFAQASREAKDERDRFEIQISTLERQKSDLEYRESELSAEVKRVEKKLETALGRAQNLRVELDGKNSSIEELVDQHENLARQFRESEQQLTQIEAENASLMRDCSSLREELCSLRQELSKQNNLVSSLRDEMKLVTEGRNRISALLSGKDENNAAVREELRQVRTEMELLSDENAKLKQFHKQGEESATSSLQDSNGEEVSRLSSKHDKREERSASDEDVLRTETVRLQKENLALTEELSSFKVLVNRLQIDLAHSQTGDIENNSARFEQNSRSGAVVRAVEHVSGDGVGITGLSLSPISSTSSFSSVSPVSSEAEQIDEVVSVGESSVFDITAGVLKLESQVDGLLAEGFQRNRTNEQGSSRPTSMISVDPDAIGFEKRIQEMQADYEQELDLQRAAHRRELARTREEMMLLWSNIEAGRDPTDEELMGHKYLKEVEHIKEVFDRGFSAMEKSHQAALKELRLTHNKELERLQKEKEELLEAEAQDTQAALKAIKKAHEIELENERSKYRELQSRMSMSSDSSNLHEKHNEIRDLSEQYSIKCLESASLHRQLDDSHLRIRDLIARNDDLNRRLKIDIDRLNRQVDARLSPAIETSSANDASHVQQINFLKSSIDVKQLELGQVRSELAKVEHQLQLTQDELNEFKSKRRSSRQLASDV